MNRQVFIPASLSRISHPRNAEENAIPNFVLNDLEEQTDRAIEKVHPLFIRTK